MDIFEVITTDHEKVKGIISQLEEKKGATKTHDKLFQKLCQEIEAHVKAEEDVFYPALQEFDDAREKVLEALEEHHIVKLLLKEMQKLSQSDEHWDAKLMVLRENIEHHMSEEEGEIFDLAQNFMDDDEIESLTQGFIQDKKKAMAKA